jgi:diaminopimelate decarboxylase
MKNIQVEKLGNIPTPFYYYDIELLQETLAAILRETSESENYHIHYAVKANANPNILKVIKDAGLGVDCVSGGEIQASLDAGFAPDKIVYAGVGKSDWEILLGLRNDIFCFNVESIPELEIINELAISEGKTANVCFRINPNVGAHTHANITTGLAENKFGIAMEDMVKVVRLAESMTNVRFLGLHFHIGSQITEMDDFQALCLRINQLQEQLEAEGLKVGIINVGGGLGIDYNNPDKNPIPDFKNYFNTYKNNLKLRPGQSLHFELGRSIVGQCGTLITKVLYVKTTTTKQFAIVDAGMTELIRPALYQAHHEIENITSDAQTGETYDIVGPICESSDVFGKNRTLPSTSRGDLIAIRSAGAYGEIMASCYNCRPLPKAYYSGTTIY